MRAGNSQGVPPWFPEAEEALGSALSTLRGSVDKHLQEFERGLDESLTTRLKSAFKEGGEAHRKLLGQAGLDGKPEAGPENPALDEEGIRAYREGVRSRVLDPLLRHLRALEAPEELARRWEGFLDGLPLQGQDLPEEIQRPEPDDMYLPRPGNGFTRRFRKALVRGMHRTAGGLAEAWGRTRKILGRDPAGTDTRIQAVPLHQVARDYLLHHCPFTLSTFSEALQQSFALPGAEISSATSAWTKAWLKNGNGPRTRNSHLPHGIAAGLETWAAASRDESPPAQEGEDAPQDEAADGTPPLREATAELQRVLDHWAEWEGPVRALSRLREAMDGEWAVLLEEVRVAGSFQASRPDRRIRKRLKRLVQERRTRVQVWTGWNSANLEGIRLLSEVLRIREIWAETENTFLSRMASEALLPLVEEWRRAGERLMELRDGAEEEIGNPAASGEGPTTNPASAIDGILSQAQEILAEARVDPLALDQTIEVAHGISDAVAGRFSDTLLTIPGSFSVAAPQEETGRVEPGVGIRVVPLGETVLKTMDVLTLESVRTSPGVLLRELEEAKGICRALPEVVRYNLVSAREELGPKGSSDPDQAFENARGLVMAGLERTAHGLVEAAAGLVPAWEGFGEDLRAPLDSSFQEIVSRAMVEGAIQEQILDLRSLVMNRIRTGASRLRVLERDLRIGSLGALGTASGRAMALIRLGRSAVGIQDQQDEDAERDLKVLREARSLLDPLPLVYRRLFSLQPVTEPSMLVGREKELYWVRQRFASWKAGGGTPCVLVGSAGIGHTSMLNVAAQTLSQEITPLRLELRDRNLDEAGLAEGLAELLSLQGQGPWTLSRVEELLEEAPVPDEFGAVFVEQAEHLFLRCPGGTRLLEDFLTFIARTSPRVFWMLTLSPPTWKYLQKAEPAATALLSDRAISTPTREEMENLILTRHSRSGLPLEFAQPEDLNPLIRRRLRLARGTEAKQAVLRRDFFERIHRTSEGSIPMAILLWLRSADFESRDGWLTVQPLRGVQFVFMQELGPQLDFALMGLLEHGSLTLEEYVRVFGGSMQEAYQVFEALRVRMLVESAAVKGSLPSQPPTILPTERYRIPPIMGQVVSHRLRDRNILH